VPFGLIAKQPDLGTAILVGAAGFYVIFFAGLPWKIIFGMAPPPPPRALCLDHAARLPAQAHPDPDRPDDRSARLGLPHHPVDHRHRLRRQFRQGLAGGHADPPRVHSRTHTDFIFAVFSEERGLLGNSILVALYLLLIAAA
jgi:rod shape determining protein RodA